MKMKFYASALIGTLAGSVLAGSVAAADLSGITVVITNTFEGHSMSGHDVPETDAAVFGMINNSFANVGDGVEYPGFLTLYDVDIADASIRFHWIESPFSARVTGPSPAGNHDRNSFVFDLPDGVSITAISFDARGSELLAGSAEPTAVVIGTNRVVTDFSDGVIRGVGFNPVFSLTIDGQ